MGEKAIGYGKPQKYTWKPVDFDSVLHGRWLFADSKPRSVCRTGGVRCVAGQAYNRASWAGNPGTVTRNCSTQPAIGCAASSSAGRFSRAVVM